MELRKNKVFLKKLYDLRNEGKSYSEISLEFEEEFERKIPPPTLSKYYDNYVSKSYVIVNQLDEGKEDAVDVVKDHSKRIKEKFGQVDNIVTSLLNKIETLMLNMDDEKFMRQVPTLLAVCKEILSQLYFLKKEQEKLIINQKNVVYSPLQINQLINKELKNLDNYKEDDRLFIKKKTKTKFDKLKKELKKKNQGITQDEVVEFLVESYTK